LSSIRVTYYRWRQEYGGLDTDQVKRLKDLETENARLRKAISDLAGSRQGKLLSPARRRAVASLGFDDGHARRGGES
jgi:hypothetical protein